MSQEICKTAFYEQGDYSGKTIFQLVCTNTPVGTIVTFKSDNPDTQPPVYLPPTSVSTYPKFTVGVACDVPAGYTCNLIYCFTLPEGVIPPPGFDMTMEALIPLGGNRYSVTKIG